MEITKKEFKEPEKPLTEANRNKLDKILKEIKGNKKFLMREDFLKLLDLSE